MGVNLCVDVERTSNFVLLPSASAETIYKSKPNKQTRTCYATLLHFMRCRAPKLTARTFYAPLLRITRNRATNRFKCAETEANHISQTPPEAGTHRGAAPEPLCVPPEKGAPRGVEQ